MLPLQSRLPLAWLFQPTSGSTSLSPGGAALPAFALHAAQLLPRSGWTCSLRAAAAARARHKTDHRRMCHTVAATAQAENKWLEKVSLSAAEQPVASALSEHLQSNMQGSVN